MSTTSLRIYQRAFNNLNLVKPIVYFLIAIAYRDILYVYHYTDLRADEFKAAFKDTRNIFDFIVVGGGSAGALISSRLSNENYNVLLLEAGGDQNPAQWAPVLSFPLLRRDFIDWQYYTTPQKNACQAMNNNQCYWPRGLGLGGSSCLNFLIYTRGHKEDYNNWARLTNDSRWSFENVLQDFKRHEDYTPRDGIWTEETKKFHNRGGEMHIEVPPFTGLADTFTQAVTQHLGYPVIDVNSDYDEGVNALTYTIKNGRRFSTFRGFILPNRHRPNFYIYKFAHVNKVLFDNGRAFGVEYYRHGKIQRAYATREIILSAGALNSPKILMLSGIGPKSHLESLGIPVVKDLPVGKALQDHVTAFIGPFVINETKSFYLERDLDLNALNDFVNNGKGPATSSGVQGTAFFSSPYENSSVKWPDLQWILLGSATYDASGKHFEHAFNVRDGVLQEFFKPTKGLDSFQIITVLSRPKSRGEILLASTNPSDPPLMDSNYYHNYDDVKVMLSGVKKAVDLVENGTVFQKLGGYLSKKPFPGCEKYEFRSDAYWECYVKAWSLTMYHPAGTCKMGLPESNETVVDSKLRVLGVRGLRVIDASIMPTIVSVNPNAASILIGEVGADIILKDWNAAEHIENNLIAP